MFTGIITAIGTISSSEPLAGGLRVELRHDMKGVPVSHGESVAVGGCCLTALEPAPGQFAADLSAETLSKTGGAEAWRVRRRVNLERSLSAGQLMGGHIVQGHVDGRVSVIEHVRHGLAGSTLRVALPAADAALIVPKGSVAIDGVSLTVASLEEGWYEIALIPETLRATTLGELHAGDAVNVEYDVLGKYVLRALECGVEGTRGSRKS